MKKFILIVFKPALLLCLLCFTVFGCSFFQFDQSDFPRQDTYTITLKNNHDQEIHIFLDREGTGFDPSNKIEGGKQRVATFLQSWNSISENGEFTVEAGRDGKVLDVKTIAISATDLRKYTVKWDGYGLY